MCLRRRGGGRRRERRLGQSRCAWLEGEVVDDGLYAGDLCGVAGGCTACGVGVDGAGEGDYTVGYRGLDGLAAEVLIGEEMGLHLGVQGVVVGLAFASSEGEREREREKCGTRGGENFLIDHGSLSSWVSATILLVLDVAGFIRCECVSKGCSDAAR